MAGVTPLWQKCRENLRIRNEYVKEGIAEFIGTGILCMFAVGASSQVLVEGGSSSSVQPVLGGIFGLMTAILVTGGISGAHINPAVSVGLAIAGELSWFKIPVYWVCQILGGYVGSGLAVAMYKSKADWFVDQASLAEGKELEYHDVIPATIFSPVPSIPTTAGTGIADQIMCTAILMMGILACIDKRNMKVPKHLLAFFICLIVGGITMAFGANAGAVMNPARDLCPRLMALTLGYPSSMVMKCSNKNDGLDERSEHWWMVGIFGPLIGASLGALMYMLLLGAHMNDDEEDEQSRSGENGSGGNPADWRSTRFIPKAQAPPIPPPQQQQFQPPPPQNPYPTNPNAGGVNNNGYRDDMRYRQGY